MIIGCKLATTEYSAETFFQNQLVTYIHNELCLCMSLLLIAAHSPNWCNILVAISVSV